MQSSPPPRTEHQNSGHSEKSAQVSPTQTDKQKKLEIVSDLSSNIKKIKPPRFSNFESREDTEA